MARFRPGIIIAIVTASGATGSGIVTLPLDTGEWLSGGIAAWVNDGFNEEERFEAIISQHLAAGDLVGMNRAAASLDLDHLLVVNCSYLDDRVITELLLFDTDKEVLISSWRGLMSLDALPLEFSLGLARVLGFLKTSAPPPGENDPLLFLERRREDYVKYFDHQ